MSLPIIDETDPGEWLESEAARLMDIVTEVDITNQKLRTALEGEEGAELLCLMKECSLLMKEVGLQYANSKHELETTLQLEKGLVRACAFLKTQRRELKAFLESRARADALEDAYLAGDSDRTTEIERQNQQLIQAAAELVQEISACTQRLDDVQHMTDKFARQLSKIEQRIGRIQAATILDVFLDQVDDP